jgi:hypothetical protein
VRFEGARLVWTALDGVERYLVTLRRVSGEEESHNVRGNIYPLEDLVPGETYAWKVVPDVKGWPGFAREAEFRVLTREEERAVDAAAQGANDLDAAIVLLALGLHEEAILRLDAAVESGEHEPSARMWRARALANLGLYEQACEDLEASGCAR